MNSCRINLNIDETVAELPAVGKETSCTFVSDKAEGFAMPASPIIPSLKARNGITPTNDLRLKSQQRREEAFQRLDAIPDAPAFDAADRS